MPQREVHSDPALSPINPMRVVIIVLAVVFLTEASVMLLFPVLPGWTHQPLASSVLDATIVSLSAVPALWFLVVRPSRGMFLARGRLIEKLFEMQERERSRLAGDLHDEVGQVLTAVIVGLKGIESSATIADAAEQATRLREAAARGLDEVRRLVRGLRPGVLEDLGLVAAVERVCEDFETTHGVKVTLSLDLAEDRFPHASVESALFRMLQEALTNIARHARATTADIALTWDRTSATLGVADDGCGFRPQSLDGDGGGHRSFGLTSLRERARVLGGQVTIRSGMGSGTSIFVKIPVKAPAGASDE